MIITDGPTASATLITRFTLRGVTLRGVTLRGITLREVIVRSSAALLSDRSACDHDRLLSLSDLHNVWHLADKTNGSNGSSKLFVQLDKGPLGKHTLVHRHRLFSKEREGERDGSPFCRANFTLTSTAQCEVTFRR